MIEIAALVVPKAPLGTTCDIYRPPPPPRVKGADNRILRYALQSVGRSWLWDSAEGLKGPWHRFAGCHRWVAWARGADGSPRRRDRIDLLHDSERMRAYYGGLQTCGNSAVCPVCSGVIYDRRRAEVAATLDHARASGWRSLFITLTAAHTSETALEPFLDALGDAMSLVYEGSPWKRFKQSCGYIGSIKGLEITRGGHGWHPHYHLLWFCERGEVSEVQAYVDRAWASALERVGLSGLKGVRAVVKDSSMTADEYIAKFDRVRGWDLDAELTMWARKEGATQKGLTPWDLLRIGLAGDAGSAEVQQARALFREYAAAIRGRHPLQFSGGLKARVGLVDVKDDAIAAGEANQVGLGVMGHLSLAGFRRLLGHDCRGELLTVAGAGEVAAVVAFLTGLGIEFELSVEREEEQRAMTEDSTALVGFHEAVTIVIGDESKAAFAFQPTRRRGRIVGGDIYSLSRSDDEEDEGDNAWRLSVDGELFGSSSGTEGVYLSEEVDTPEKLSKLVAVHGCDPTTLLYDVVPIERESKASNMMTEFGLAIWHGVDIQELEREDLEALSQWQTWLTMHEP